MADNNGELQLKITLDDGSIVQGFLNINKKAKESGKEVGDNLGKGVDAFKQGLSEVAPQTTAIGSRIFTALATPLGLVTASVVLLGSALKGAFELTLEGEKLNKLDKQFDSLAKTFGVAGDELKNKFIDSLGGLTDDSDAIQSLNKAFVTLGDKVTQLPQIMELARKATNLFGGEVTDNFEKINQAVATGATRQLRGLGIVIDADKAYEKYARSLGVTKDVLSEAGKQQAILNEVLARGNDRFKDVASETGGLTSAYTRFKISLNNLGEDIAKSFAASGGFLENFFTGLDIIVKKLSGDPKQKLEDFQIEMNNTKVRLFELQDALEKRQNASGFQAFLQPFKDGEGSAAAINHQINLTKIKLEEMNKKFSEVSAKAATVGTGAGTGGDKPDTNKGSVDQELALAARLKREKELTDFLLQQDQTRLQNKIQQNSLLLNENSTASERLAILNDNFNIQDQLREEQKNQQIRAIQEKYRLDKQTGSTFEKQSLAAIDESFFQQQLLAEKQRAVQLKTIQAQSSADSLGAFSAVGNGFSQIADGAGQAARNFAANSNAAFKQVGAQAFSTISQGVGRAFNNFGAALARGEDAGAAFADAIGESLIQIASQFGDTFIQIGIGKLAASYGADATGYTLIAAGAALKILAGAAGGKKSAPSQAGSADTGGGISSQPNFSDNPSTNLERRKPDTNVQVVINGDVLDSDESGSRIVDLINSAFDKKGVVINQRGVA